MRRFKPLPADHPLVGEACPACRKPFAPGDETTLIPLGPGDDPEGQKAALEGRAYHELRDERDLAVSPVGKMHP